MDNDRRKFLAAGGAAFTTLIFTGNLKGANDRIAVGFIGVGRQGNANLSEAMREPDAQVAAICDVYRPNLERTVATAEKAGHKPRSFKDFRDLLADKSIDAVCIATPDHWHALMTVEACKAGKDVYVEKPVCTYVDEAPKMVQAMQKYKRVVQAGTQRRSQGHMPAIRELLRGGQLGVTTSARVWINGSYRRGDPQEVSGPVPPRPRGTVFIHRLGWSHQKPQKRALERKEGEIRRFVREDWPRVKKKRRAAGRPYRLRRRIRLPPDPHGRPELGACLKDTAAAALRPA